MRHTAHTDNLNWGSSQTRAPHTQSQSRESSGHGVMVRIVLLISVIESTHSESNTHRRVFQRQTDH